MPVAVYVPLTHGPVPGWVVIAAGVLLVILGAVFVPGGRPGFGVASGRVVEHRPGKRPTVVEFSPPGAAPVRFKHARRLPVGTEVVVSYSEADPRNAHVGRERSTRGLGVACLVLGAVFVVLGILR